MRSGWSLLLILFTTIVGFCCAQGAKRPNILFIFADDLGYEDLSIQGSKHLKTPNIDSIANNGVKFNAAYSLAGRCSPARSALLTGKNPATFGHIFNPPHTHEDSKAGMPLGMTILPQTLRKAGYRTMIIGKWHLGYHALLYPIARGFSRFFGFLGGRFSYWDHAEWNGRWKLWIYIYNYYNNPPWKEHLTIKFTDKAIEFITESKAANKPYFLYLAYNAPHGPLDVIQGDLDNTIPPGLRPYAAMVTRLDKEIGRLVDHIERLGMLRNTFIVFTNDNGGQLLNGASNAPYRGNKGSYLEGGIRIPMFMQWTGKIRSGTSIDHPVSLMDMYPTFQEVARVPTSRQRRDLDGVDLMPYIPKVNEGPPVSTAPHKYLILGGENTGMVRKGVFKLWVRFFNTSEMYLYNTDKDKEERRNLSRVYPGLYAELSGIFRRWYRELPSPHFLEDSRKNPITVTIAPLQIQAKVNKWVEFRAFGSNLWQKTLDYSWEVFPAYTKRHAQDFLQVRDPSAPIQTPNEKDVRIKFKASGDWVVRVNASYGDFTKWYDLIVSVQ